MLRLPTAANQVILPAAILLFYFVVPVSSRDAPVGELIGLAIGLLSIVAATWVILGEVRRAEKRLKPIHLLLAFELVLVTFSFAYYLLAVNYPNQFVGLTTRLDALYFSLATMSTVGYGDVHAAGQISRLIVTSQLAFNLVFIAALVALLQDQVRRRISRRQPPAPGEDDSD